jgi:hypothetical protein
MIEYKCPSMTPDGLCDRPALYLVNGTALCMVHARELVEALHRALALEALRQRMPPNGSG